MNTRSTRRSHRSAAALAITTVTLAAVALSSAATSTAAPRSDRHAPAFALVRGAHFSPDTPGVDVYLTSYSGGRNKLWLSGVGYGDVSPYRRIKPGPYVVSMRPHGAARTTPAALSWTLDAKPGAAYTAAAVGHNAKLHGIVLRDQLSAPRTGTGDLRVIQAASRLPQAKLVAGSQTVASDARFATTSHYATVPAGTWTVRASGPTSSAPTASRSVDISPSGVYTLVVLDSKGSGVQLRVLRDASGAGTSPTGSIDAGGGGTATTRVDTAGSDDALLWLIGSALLLMAAGAGSLAVARRRPAA
jgi:hypothetical protein